MHIKKLVDREVSPTKFIEQELPSDAIQSPGRLSELLGEEDPITDLSADELGNQLADLVNGGELTEKSAIGMLSVLIPLLPEEEEKLQQAIDIIADQVE